MRAGEKEKLKAKFNAVAAAIMFNKALDRGDNEEARKIAKVCIEAQEKN